MAESSASIPDLLSKHVRDALDDWTRTAKELQAAFAVTDTALLAERPASKLILTPS